MTKFRELCHLYLDGRVSEYAFNIITMPMADQPNHKKEARAAEIMTIVKSCATEQEMIEKIQNATWE